MGSTRIPSRRLTPRNLPRQARSQATVEAILEAAAQVFERYGYAAGTTNRIADRAGVSIGSVYQYFPNKDAILVALVHRHLAEGTAALRTHVEGLIHGARFDDELPGIVEAMVAIHAVAPSLHRVLFEEAQLPPSLRAELDALEDQLIELVSRSLTGDLSKPSLSARMAISAIEGLTHRLVLRLPAGVTPEEIGREITKLVRAYLQSSR